MVELRRIKVFLFVMLVLQFSAVNGQIPLTLITRVGDDVTLPCKNMIEDQVKCDSTTWLSGRHAGAGTNELITLGKINEGVYPKARADRLNVTEKCSLVIKNVTVEDVGRYTCRQFRSNTKQGGDFTVDLSVVSLTESQWSDPDKISFSCSVLTFESSCGHTVQWLYEGNQNDIEIRPGSCLAEAILTIPLDRKSNYYKLLKCNVTHDESGQMRLFGVERDPTESGGSTEEPETNKDWLTIILIIVAVSLVAVFIIVAVLRWRKTKGSKRQRGENITQTLKPAATMPTQEANQDMAAPEEGVAYASISYKKKTNARATVDYGDEGDAVTYSTVKVASSSSSDGASADPNCLYATVNKKEETV